jgi:uncharacterized membrane protein
MNKNRLEAFSDGVIAIIITIMVLELKVPHNPTWQTYLDAFPIFISYGLSFVLVGLYWSTHHHLFHLVHKVDNKILWMNMLVLFWQSLIPFTTATMGENKFTNITVMSYAFVLTMSSISHIFLVNSLIKLHGQNSSLALYSKKNNKTGYLTLATNISAFFIALIGFPKIAFILIALVALLWFLPAKITDSI